MKRQNKTKQKKKTTKRVKVTAQLGNQIISFLNNVAPQKQSIKTLYKTFKVKDKKSRKEFLHFILHLADEGFIKRIKGTYFQGTREADSFEGVVDYVNPHYAYILVEGMEKDIWVSSNNLNRALDGDRVQIRTFYNNRRNRLEGEVTEVVKRSRSEFVGTIEISSRFAFVIVDDRKMHFDVFVNLDDIQEAQHGERVIVEITEWSPTDKNPVGIVKRVLGKSGENETEIHAIMFEYGLPFNFPEHVELAAANIPDKISQKEIDKRRDMREVTTFTIDPFNAKDFDDALSIRKTAEGHWEIGIHIADVTHYVKPNTELEMEAYNRATSVYLVDRTVPMLPEKLSNQLCSLRPHEDKLTFSAVFVLDEYAQVQSEWFGRTVIHSDRRFTYEEAQEAIETGEGDFTTEINTLNELAKKLQKERFAHGAISFESVELVFHLDETGSPLGLFPKVRKDAHKLIEEFMLLANKKVAEFVFRQKEKGKPKTMVYRTHDNPDPEKVANFSNFAKRFGYELNLNETNLASSLNQLAKELEGKPEQNIIESQAIRAMAKAVYTTQPLGHYGLGFKHYSHFTSPIRRYPDMMAHRLLQQYLDGGNAADKAEFEERCKHSSERERRAVEAERASIKFKQVEFMQNYIDEEMEGIVSGVTEWGIYVELNTTKCEGMVRLSSMQDDFYYYDEENKQVIGKKYKQTYAIGDPVKILVKNTNIAKRTIDFEML
ncbi:ribonuclease R [Rapidithrix thailandica]|uniref:Ribonuclease R n=1 Tax=Rapidithrix thailandica TaxID=413964 RepID=A0AAW9SG84_9BACT